MKAVLRYKRTYLLLLLPFSMVLLILAKQSLYFSEQVYAKGIYKILSQGYSLLTGILPISLAEILIVILPAIGLALLVRFFFLIITDKGKRSLRIKLGVLNIVCTISVLWFSFLLFGGLNYYRASFTQYSGLVIEKSSVKELYELTEILAREANELRAQVVTTDDEGVFRLSVNKYQLAKQASKAFEALSEDYPVLKGSYGPPKPILLSKIMSQTEITGIFIPFTMEANVNVDIPDYNIPVTMLHELAHVRGFMREDEANYLAYLAGMKSESIEFRYSSTMLALVMSGNALYKEDKELYYQVTEQYSEDVVKDFRDNSTYWSQFEDTIVSTVSNKVNDTYLKANNQTDGVRSYDRMLDLLLARYRKEQQTVE